MSTVPAEKARLMEHPKENQLDEVTREDSCSPTLKAATTETIFAVS